ncbi:MAG TPA: class I SAM-dependent methyltransferase [Chthoniobacterales bacterium]
MNLLRKVSKLAQPMTYQRGWRRAQRLIFPLPLAPMIAQIDPARLREIKQRYADSSRGYAKYANVRPWLHLGRQRVQDLKLHRLPPQRILDLGCGGGFFLFILKQLNHDVLGLDLHEPELYRELVQLFGVPRVEATIRPFEPLPDLGRRFDWITAFSISFDRATNGKARWGRSEWDFLLQDLQHRNLAPGGKMYFELNPGVSGDFYTQELHDFFVSRGARVERERVFFADGLC